MGFSALLHSGICFGPVGGCEHFSSTGSTLFGSALRHPAARVYGVNIDRKFVGAAVRKEFSGREKREEEEKNKLLGVASASIGVNAVLLMSVTKPALRVSHKDSPSNGLSLPLLAVWGAILLNSFVQYRILERLTCLPQRRESAVRVDVGLKERVAELEENVREFVTTARGLSKQVEKLGVRFRVTKRTLRDPMQETVAYAQKTSEVTAILAQRDDRLEEELRGLQRALMAMQEHQVKQLALITLALKRTQNEGQALDSKKSKTFPSSVNGSGSVFKPSSDAHAGSFNATEAARDVVTPKQTAGRSSNSAKGAGSDMKAKAAGDEHSINGTSQRSDSPLKSTFSSEESLSKIDFWKDSVAMPSSDKTPVASSATSDRGDGAERSELGNFFNGRKRTVMVPNPSPESNPNADLRKSGTEILPDSEDASSYVEQPDYDSDSWLR